MRTNSDVRQEQRNQTKRHNSMTWQEIRDDAINKLKDLATSVTSGVIEKEIQEERYAICEDCSEFKKLTRQCKVCSCFMPAKTLFNKSRCPKGYWNK
tara:strand:+ start:60 stop:350 length:291 start_codon:yes stop_codon:yes gene_type:complete